MNFSVFSVNKPAATAGTPLAVRLPLPVTAQTGCVLSFTPLACEAPAAMPVAATPSRRPAYDVHQASYYAQCRAAMGY